MPRNIGPGRGTALAALLLCWTATGCGSVVDPPLPSGAVAFTPPAVYARWWALTESCAGLTRNMGELSWYVVPDASSFPNGAAGEADGAYLMVGSKIVLAGQRQNDPTVVRHEMLHALLRNQPGHPRPYFLGGCAGVVACGEACIRDAGAAPVAPAGTPVVPASALRVAAELSPAAPSTSRDGGWFTLTVTATNPGPTAVLVSRSSLPYDPSFSYEIAPDPRPAAGPSIASVITYDVYIYDASARQFAAGESKRYVFDFQVVPARAGTGEGLGSVATQVVAGRYSFRGAFGGRGVGPWSAAIGATLGP